MTFQTPNMLPLAQSNALWELLPSDQLKEVLQSFNGICELLGEQGLKNQGG